MKKDLDIKYQTLIFIPYSNKTTMKRIRKYFKTLRLKREVKRWERQKTAMLSLIKDRSWDIRDPFVLKLYKENNVKIKKARINLCRHELS